MRILVTGGGGFIGKALVNKLISLGHQLTIIARNDYPELVANGVKVIKLDLGSDFSKVCPAFSEIDVVFHIAAKVAMWGDYQDFYQANVVATQNVIDACQFHKISKLIFTSSPSVISDGSDLNGVNETYPYPKKHIAYYPMTKAEAERRVLSANSENLKTISLRPHLIFGPGDNNFVPLILKRALSGKLKIIGSGKNLVDFTYIDDCVDAHLLAMQALDLNSNASGKAYFISQGDPVRLWDWINLVLELNNLPQLNKKIPYFLAYSVSMIMEVLASLRIIKEPLFTRFLISEMAHAHYFDITAAKRDLGYSPKYKVFDACYFSFKNK